MNWNYRKPIFTSITTIEQARSNNGFTFNWSYTDDATAKSYNIYRHIENRVPATANGGVNNNPTTLSFQTNYKLIANVNQPIVLVTDIGKEEETVTDENLTSSIGKFLITLLIIIFILIFNFSAGGCVLYGCKIGQANILPTDEKCMPYENNIPSIQQIQINICLSSVKFK